MCTFFKDIFKVYSNGRVAVHFDRMIFRYIRRPWFIAFIDRTDSFFFLRSYFSTRYHVSVLHENENIKDETPKHEKHTNIYHTKPFV